MRDLMTLVKMAEDLAQPEPYCTTMKNHPWDTDGGRPCPRGGDGSQPVYVCRACDTLDYGYPGGPGFDDCYGDRYGCEGCFTIQALMELGIDETTPWDPIAEYRRVREPLEPSPYLEPIEPEEPLEPS